VVGGWCGNGIAIGQGPRDEQNSVIPAHRYGPSVKRGIKRASDDRSKTKFARPQFGRLRAVGTPPVVGYSPRRHYPLPRNGGRHSWRRVIEQMST
jgi:hypothetical protein